MFKSSVFFFATALLAVLCLPIASRNPQAASPGSAPAQAAHGKDAAKPAADSLARAKTLYARDCALCHGDTGDGKTDTATGMSLTMGDWTNPKTLADKSDSELFNIIRNGKDKMPPEDVGRATDAEVRGLIVYIRSLARNTPPEPAAAPAPAPSTN